MNIDEMLEISDCPLCEGGALLEEECGCSYYVMCLECGCHTVNIDFRSEQERLDAAKRAVMLWNTGKVISSRPRRMRMLNVNFAGEIFQGCLTHFSLCATIHGKAMKETIVYAVTLRQERRHGLRASCGSGKQENIPELMS
ncbi:MAG: Lar family restriction alleviation protein [Clostridium sp.]